MTYNIFNYTNEFAPKHTKDNIILCEQRKTMNYLTPNQKTTFVNINTKTIEHQ